MIDYFKILSCPSCGTDINASVNACTKCGRDIYFKNSRIYFTRFGKNIPNNPFFKIKHFIKYRTAIYDNLVSTFGPVFSFPLVFSVKKFFKKYRTSSDIVIVNIGSGNTRLLKDIINVDLIDYKNVNIVSDIDRLPFRDNSIDILINIAVLEHVKNPEATVEEINRVLKPGGMVYSYIPFLQPFHASPFDYNRYTSEGIINLYRNFELMSLKPTAGPMSALLWIFQEWLAMIFSFGIKPLHYLLYLTFMFLTFPIKVIDILLVHHPLAKNIASGFSIIVKKK
jgi:SAM-dependent methyltransferase